MNCTNITVGSIQVNCINQSNAEINATLQAFQNNSQIPSLSPPYTSTEILLRLIAYISIMVPAFIGNVIVLISFIIDRKLLSTFNLFLLNMAIIDLLTAIFRMGFNVLTIASIRGWVRPYSWSICQFNGFMQALVHTSNVLTLLLMAVFRYLVVVHSKGYLVTISSVLIAIGVSWILSITEALLPILGWNRYAYQIFEIACLPDWAYEKTFPIFVMLLAFGIPLIVMIYCYSMIYWTVKKNSKRVRTMSHSGGNDNALKKIASREAKVTRAMFIVFATFIICFGPYCICMFILFPVFSIWVGKDAAFVCGWLINFNSVINPIAYPCVNHRFKKAYNRIFCHCCKKGDMHTFANSSSATTVKYAYAPGKTMKLRDSQSPINSHKIHRNGTSTRSVYFPRESDLIYNDFED